MASSSNITPLDGLYNILKNRSSDVEDWFASRWGNNLPNLYLSCDLRHSGFKIGIVDTNIFPSGFNNLCHSFSKEISTAFGKYLDAFYPQAGKILIFAEEHTRNKFYLKNLLRLETLLRQTGREIAVGVRGEFLNTDRLEIDLEEGRITLNKLTRKGEILSCRAFEPDLVVLNNDLSSGLPDLLDGIGQPVIPVPQMGWYKRRKSNHFLALSGLITDFSARFRFDPWLICPYTDLAPNVDLKEESSLKILAEKVESILAQTQKKYAEYGITESPYAYLKNNAGTYGLGILPVFSGEEVLGLNRRKKNRLLSSKGNLDTTAYLIQEGIPTRDSYSGYPIEPVIYVVGKRDMGGFFRIHDSKNQLESLNAPGMTFSCLCLHKLGEPHEEFFLDCKYGENVVELSRFLSRIASLAVVREMEDYR